MYALIKKTYIINGSINDLYGGSYKQSEMTAQQDYRSTSSQKPSLSMAALSMIIYGGGQGNHLVEWWREPSLYTEHTVRCALYTVDVVQCSVYNGKSSRRLHFVQFALHHD